MSVDLVAAGFCSFEEDCCVVEEEEEEEDDSVLEEGAELALLSFDDSATAFVVDVVAAA